MLIGLLSDPHANLVAVEAVLRDVEAVGPDLVICLGDFVGYGAEPNQVVQALRECCAISLVGNHDLAVLGAIDVSWFHPVAAQAALWTRNQLDPQNRAFLEGLSPREVVGDLELAHASLRDPVSEYVVDALVAEANFMAYPFETAAVGHTHVPALFTWSGEVLSHQVKTGAALAAGGARVLMNPGGIGQPRDRDPRASWATWDTEARTFSVRKVSYPIHQAQRSILAAGLPEVLAHRLAEGW